MYTDIEIQDLDMCHRGACHDHKEDCETCTLHYEVVCDLFRRHCLQYKQSCNYEIEQVFRIDNKDVKNKFEEKQNAMRIADTVLIITGCGMGQVNGEYCRDPVRPRIFQRLHHESWVRRNEELMRIKEHIAVFLDKARDGKEYWCIKAFQRVTEIATRLDPSLPKTVHMQLLYICPVTNKETPPIRDWRAVNGVKGPVPRIQIRSKKVVVHSKGDLESATRNYFREYFFRNSLDGRNISNCAIKNHIANTMTGKPAARKASLREKKIGWSTLMKELLKDNVQHQAKLKQFLQKQSDAADVRWAWHGTNSKAVKSIASKNFNSSFCKRQVHGKGHYFSPDPHLTFRYAPDTHGADGKPYKCLLLCQVLLGHTTASRTVHGDSNTHQDFCYVVPDDRQIWPVYVVVIRC